MVGILVCSNNAFEEQLGFHKVLLGELAEGVKRFLFLRMLIGVLAKLDDMTCKGSGLSIGAASSLSDKPIGGDSRVKTFMAVSGEGVE